MKHLTILLTLAILGCNSVSPPIQGRNDPFESKQIQFATDELKNDTTVSAPVLSRDETGGLLFVTVPIRSTINQTAYIEYRVTFFDKNHQQINQTTWFRKTLEPNTPDRISVNSTSPQADDFQVDFRYAR